MKKIAICFLLLISVLFSLNSCIYNDDNGHYQYGSAYNPVYMKRSDFENSVKVTAPKQMVKPGKIYVKDHYLFIGDTNKGFHVYNNQDPTNPILISFIEIPGVTDIAIRNDVFYANQAVDLIAFKLDITNQKINVVKRIPNTFPDLVSPDGFIQNVGNENVVVDWN